MKYLFYILVALCAGNYGKDLKSKAQVHKDNIKELTKGSMHTIQMGDYEDRTRKLASAIAGLKEVKGEAVAQKNFKYAKELDHTIQTYQGVADKHKPTFSNDKYGQSSKYKK